MPKLILKRKAEILDEIVLDEARSSFIVGSDPACDLVVRDKQVSMTHLRIERHDGSYYIEDLGSAFGTYLNGRPLSEKAQIVDGDEIAIGSHNLVFEHMPGLRLDRFTEQAADLLSDDRSSSPSGGGANGGATSDSVTADSAPQSEQFYEVEALTEHEEETELQGDDSTSPVFGTERSYYLLAIYGPYIGKKFALNKGETRIGRDSTLNDIVIRNNEKGVLDQSISRRHATISYRDGRFFVSDKRSKTRTYVNQIKLTPTDEVPAYENDEIEIVSDQKSTIFRLLPEGEYDMSPPKKAGVWWIRNNLKLGVGLTALLACLTLASWGMSCKMRAAVNKKPDEIKLIEEAWYQWPENEVGANGSERSSWEDGALALTDLNGDGGVDVVAVSPAGHLRALDGATRSTIWEHPQLAVEPGLPLVLSDLNQNGLPDVLVAAADTRLRAFDSQTGAEIWLSPLLGETVAGPPVVGDFNGDQLPDVAVCTRDGQVHLGYTAIYQPEWKTVETGLQIRSAPSCADWDGDGADELFLGTEKGKVLILNGRSAKIATVFDFNDEVSKATGDYVAIHPIRAALALGDIEGSGQVDLLVASTSSHYLAMEGKTLRRIWHQQLPIKSSRTIPAMGPVLGKFDDDDLPDILLVSNAKLQVIRGSAERKNAKQTFWLFDVPGDDELVTPATLGDLNKDGAVDVFIGTRNGTLYCFDGANGDVLAEIANDANPIVSPILIADLNSDGLNDLVFMRRNGNIYRVQTTSPLAKNDVVWGQAFAGAGHTCLYRYRPPQPTTSNVLTATFGCLLLFAGGLTYMGRQKREKTIQQNQSHAY